MDEIGTPKLRCLDGTGKANIWEDKDPPKNLLYITIYNCIINLFHLYLNQADFVFARVSVGRLITKDLSEDFNLPNLDHTS